MSGQPALGAAPAPQPDPAAPAPAGADLCRELVDELLLVGRDVARLVQKRAVEETACLPPPDCSRAPLDLAVAFDRVARALRRTVLLRKHLDKPMPAPAQQRTAARRQIIRAVENTIHRECERPGEAESLHAEFLERLDGPDLEDDIGNRPIDAIITDICRDLGLGSMPFTPPPPRRTPADIAALCALAAKPRQTDPATPPQSEYAAKPAGPSAAPRAIRSSPSCLQPADAGLCRLLAATEPI